MRLVYDPRLCIHRQIGGFRLEPRVTEADVCAALNAMDLAGVRLEDIQAVIGIALANWSQEEFQRVAGLAYAFRRRRLPVKEFEVYAESVRRAMACKPDRWELDVSPMDILRLERPLSFDPDDDSEDES